MIDFSKKKLFLLDMDGTLYLGRRLFPETPSFLDAVKRSGGTYLYLTNNSSRGVHTYVEHLASMGIGAKETDFLTSADALILYLKREALDGRLLYAFGTASFRKQLRDAGFRLTDRADDGAELLVSGFDTELTFRKLEDACRLLTRGIPWIATNPDWVCPTEWGSVPDCGSVSEMLFRATGKRPLFIGKPEPYMAELAMARMGCTKEETVMIGDRIYTDIACGVNAGIDAAFVLSGEGVREDIEKYGVVPDGIYKDVGEIAALLAKAARN